MIPVTCHSFKSTLVKRSHQKQGHQGSASVIKNMTSTLRQTLSYLLRQLFTGVKLLQQLHRDGIYATGTIREDRRGFPSALKTHVKKGLKERGESEIRQSEVNTNLTVCVWQDTKAVTTCSTFCPTAPQDTGEKNEEWGVWGVWEVWIEMINRGKLSCEAKESKVL